MRELVGLMALLGALLGIYLIGSSANGTGLLGLLLLTGAGLFLLYRALSGAAQENYRLLSQQIFRLEEHLKALQDKPRSNP